MSVRDRVLQNTVEHRHSLFPGTRQRFRDRAEKADQAMYTSKNRGKNQVTAYSGGLNAPAAAPA
jgi:GGDEF domain-containing protein